MRRYRFSPDLLCFLSDYIRSGVPTGITARYYTPIQNLYLSIENHLRIVLYRVKLTLCSQKQTNANSGKEIHTTVPIWSRPEPWFCTVKTLSSLSGCLSKIVAIKFRNQNTFFINNLITSLNAFGGIRGTYKCRRRSLD
jgi:hypothetical protein